MLHASSENGGFQAARKRRFSRDLRTFQSQMASNCRPAPTGLITRPGGNSSTEEITVFCPYRAFQDQVTRAEQRAAAVGNPAKCNYLIDSVALDLIPKRPLAD